MEKKKVQCITAPTVRALVEAINNVSITKGDVIQILESRGQYHLFYYE